LAYNKTSTLSKFWKFEPFIAITYWQQVFKAIKRKVRILKRIIAIRAHTDRKYRSLIWEQYMMKRVFRVGGFRLLHDSNPYQSSSRWSRLERKLWHLVGLFMWLSNWGDSKLKLRLTSLHEKFAVIPFCHPKFSQI